MAMSKIFPDYRCINSNSISFGHEESMLEGANIFSGGLMTSRGSFVFNSLFLFCVSVLQSAPLSAGCVRRCER